MSLTIKPNKRTKKAKEFLTNISLEDLIGAMCFLCGAAYFDHRIKDERYPLLGKGMAYEMTPDQAADAVEKLRSYDFVPHWEEELKYHFESGATPDALGEVIKNFTGFLEESNGYKTVN